MRKTIFTMLTVVMTTAPIFAQMKKKPVEDYSYKVSSPYEVFDAKEKIYFSKGHEVMALKLDGKEVMIQKFDSDKPAFIKEQKYEKYFPKNYSVEDALEVGDKFYFFYSSWDGDNDKEQLFAVEMDFTKGEFVGEHKLVMQIDGKIAGTQVRDGAFSMAVADKFDFFQSRDKKNFLVQYRKKPKVKSDVKSYDIIGVNVFDANLGKVSGKEYTMPYTERVMNNLDFHVDNKGNLYMLVKVFHDDSNDDKKRRKDEVANYHLELFMVKKGSEKIEISKFDNNDKFINKLWIFDTSKDFIIAGGFYNNGKGDYDDIDGIITFKIKEDGTIYDSNSHEIPVEVLNQYESGKTKRKNERKERNGDSAKFSDLELNDLSVNEDGSMVLVGEQYYTVYHSRAGMGMNGMSSGGGYYSYHYCDILITKINPDGSLAWMNKVPKNQMGTGGRGGMSYKYFNANNSHYLVYLDNVKNMDLPVDKTPARHTDGAGGYLTAVKVADVNGVVTKGSILNSREVGDIHIYQFSTNRIVKTSESSFLLEVYKKKKEDIMIKVDLK